MSAKGVRLGSVMVSSASAVALHLLPVSRRDRPAYRPDGNDTALAAVGPQVLVQIKHRYTSSVL
jgi:hypothetical protein